MTKASSRRRRLRKTMHGNSWLLFLRRFWYKLHVIVGQKFAGMEIKATLRERGDVEGKYCLTEADTCHSSPRNGNRCFSALHGTIFRSHQTFERHFFPKSDMDRKGGDLREPISKTRSRKSLRRRLGN